MTTRPVLDAPVTVFSNIPNPYNDRLFAALRAQGAVVRAVYRRTPAAEGRPWPADLHPDDTITRSLVAEARAWRRAAGTHVVLTGSYATALDVARRVVTSPAARTVHVWGERLRPNHAVVHLARRGYHAPLWLDGVLAVGSRAVATYEAVMGGGRAAPPVHTFPYTTDRGLLVPPAPAPGPVVGYAGRLLPHKGLSVVLRALAHVPEASRPHLVVAGDGPAAGLLAREADALGLGGAITWLGARAPAALDEERARWWLEVVPSQRNEGWGVVVPEALNSAVPVVASAHVNAAVDLVRDGVDGAVLAADESDDPRAWARVLTEVLADRGAREAMAARARVVGAAMAVEPAATFLLEVLRDAELRRAHRRPRARGGPHPPPRSFVDEGWHRVAAAAGAEP